MHHGNSVDRSRAIRGLAAGAILLFSNPRLVAQEIDLPPRPAGAPTGMAVAAAVRDLPLDGREAIIEREVLSGNVPAWWRHLVPVRMTRIVAGREVSVVFAAAPDYLLVGSDDDWFLMPLRPETAQRIADATGMSLPTPVMVDAIWAAATARLAPDSLTPSAAMVTMPVFAQHQRLVRGRREVEPAPPGALVAGHKKDVVLTVRLDTLPRRVAIYGWHRPDGTHIQPLYTGHGTAHVDYSHGIRLVSRTILLDGVAHDMLDVLRDPTVAAALSDEGIMRSGRYPTMSPPTDGGQDGDR